MPGQEMNLLFLIACLLEYVFMFPFPIGSGNGELCLRSRTSAWQTLHCAKRSDSNLKAFGAFPQRHLKAPWILTDCACSARASSSPGHATTLILSDLTPFPLVNFWEGETFDSKCSAIPGSQDHCWLTLYRDCALLREGAFPIPSKVPALPEPYCSTDLFVLLEYYCFLPFSIINKNEIPRVNDTFKSVHRTILELPDSQLLPIRLKWWYHSCFWFKPPLMPLQESFSLPGTHSDQNVCMSHR